MQKLIALVALMLVAASTIAMAETCSGRRGACIAGEKSRGAYNAATSSCNSAYRVCMKTGVWDTTAGGAFGRRIEGIEKR